MKPNLLLAFKVGVTLIPLAVIAHSKKESGSWEYNFNVYDVTIDCGKQLVTIESELDPTPDGKTTLPLSDFAKALANRVPE
jgi:hypothetical protein